MNFAAISAALPQTAVTTLDSLPFPGIALGQVCEIFDLGEALLLTATNRISTVNVFQRFTA